jgi:quinol monooxygenase YgiN
MYLRVTYAQFDPTRYDELTRLTPEIMTAIQQISGCLGVEHAMSRTSGRAVTISRWPTEEQATATEPRAHIPAVIERLKEAGLAYGQSEIYEVLS